MGDNAITCQMLSTFCTVFDLTTDFKEVLPQVAEAIEQCTFLAFDEEFTGESCFRVVKKFAPMSGRIAWLQYNWNHHTNS